MKLIDHMRSYLVSQTLKLARNVPLSENAVDHYLAGDLQEESGPLSTGYLICASQIHQSSCTLCVCQPIAQSKVTACLHLDDTQQESRQQGAVLSRL
jgi:hypothetical protein